MKHGLVAMAIVAGLAAQGATPGSASVFSAPPTAIVLGWLKHAADPGSHAFQQRSQERDGNGLIIHRYDHYYKGIRILKSDGIVHADDSGNVVNSKYAYGLILEPSKLDLAPAFSATKALEIVGAKDGHTQMGLIRPTAELVIEPILETFRKEGSLPIWGDPGPGSNAQAYGRTLKDYRLIYLVHSWDSKNQELMGYKINAKTGALIESFHTSSCASGTAQGLYSSNTPIPVACSGGSYSLVSGIFSTFDNNSGYLYAKGSQMFGDGQIYLGVPMNANGETAAADAFFGALTVYNFYQNVFGRNGIDGYSVPLYVHDSSLAGNARASWYKNADTSFSYWISFGDAGGGLGSMVDTDIVAHEYSHLVNYRTAQVGRDGGSIEQHAIDEANSDILAAFSKIWFQNGGGSTVGYSDPANRTHDWVNGGRVARVDKGGNGSFYCIRDLAWPSGKYQTGFVSYPYNRSQSWYNGSTWQDGHNGTGPIARGMYILSQGLNPYVGNNEVPGHQWTSPFLPLGMSGIGPDAAARIWYQALTHYFTSNMAYLHLWSALEFAAIDLYGRGSLQHQAVNNALAAVNLAAPWHTTDLLTDVEPNDTMAQATVLPQGHVHHVYAGNVAPNGDVDFYRLTVPAGHTLSIWVTSDLSEGTPLADAIGFELRDINNVTLLRDSSQNLLEYKIASPYTLNHIRNIDEPDPPAPDGYMTRAFYHYKNVGNGDQVVYLKIRQSTADSQGGDYTLDVRDWVMDVAYQDGMADQW